MRLCYTANKDYWADRGTVALGDQTRVKVPALAVRLSGCTTRGNVYGSALALSHPIKIWNAPRLTQRV